MPASAISYPLSGVSDGVFSFRSFSLKVFEMNFPALLLSSSTSGIIIVGLDAISVLLTISSFLNQPDGLTGTLITVIF